MDEVEKIYYIDRLDGVRKEEKIYFEKTLRFLYGTSWGRFLNIPVSKLPVFSHLFGWWQRLPFSTKKIAPFILKYNIDSKEFAEEIDHFANFDAFFTRKLKPETRPLAPGVIVPADGRYLVYPDLSNQDGFIVKGERFDLSILLQSTDLASRYQDGSMVIVRLCPSDYHRFHFPLDCLPGSPQLINGPLRSVNPLAIRRNIHWLVENKRFITHLQTPDHGLVLFIEIGATSVGSVHQTFIPQLPAKRGQEKGYFSFGASSIILLFERGRIDFSSDLFENSKEHIETRCLFGQALESHSS